ncbi:hypothetical protein SE86_03685 [Acidilobus sp. 7A]|nr:hypothetical protein SE86_03685 [Acidilobus sp. 7A]
MLAAQAAVCMPPASASPSGQPRTPSRRAPSRAGRRDAGSGTGGPPPSPASHRLCRRRRARRTLSRSTRPQVTST